MEANHWKDYFNFSKKERTGIITLLLLLVLTWFLPALFSPSPTFNHQDVEAFKKEVALFEQEANAQKAAKENIPASYHQQDFSSPAAEKIVLFYFDPNTLQQEDWKKLGLKDKTISTILNYVSKGGKFFKPEDLSRIYGLSKNDYERLRPYVRIPEKEKQVYAVQEKPAAASSNISRVTQININTADTLAFIALPGIGSKLANRIINFRQKLGGFYSVDQIGEVFGLADSTFQKIKPRLICNAADIQKININSATIEQLKAHPYIKYQIGNAVIQYRNQHGNFQSINDLKQIQIITDEVFRKLAPYLSER
jgi:competence protein ComEA